MTPDFALSLSFEGIRLLHRGPGGWTPVGEVPLDSRDLTGDLAALRRAGLALGVPWQGTKLLLPEEQIRTLTLDDPGAGIEAARTALDGATPYAVNDLVIDQVSDGTRTHVAAVARETLEEAFAFAAEHGFQPVSFAARLGADYPVEAFFGPTRIAASVLKGETVTREAPAAAPAGEPEDDTPQIHRAPKAAPVAAPSAAADPVPAPVTPAPVDARPAAASPADASPEAPAAEAAPPEPAAAPMEPSPAPPGRRAPLASPPPRAGTPLLASGRSDAARTRPLQGATRDTGAPAATPDMAPRPAREGARVEPRVGQPSRTTAPAPLAAPPDTARRASPILPPKPSAPSRREPPVAAQAPAVPMMATTSAEALAATLQAPRRQPAAEATSPARASFPFGRKGEVAAKVGGKPRHLAILLTVALLVIMAAVAVLAAVSDQTLAGLFQRGSAPATEVAAVSPAEEPEVAAVAPQPDVQAAAAVVAAALAEMPEASSPEDAGALIATNAAWIDVPGPLAQPEAAASPDAGLDSEPAAARTPAPLPTLVALAPDAPFAAPEPPPAPRAEEPADEAPAVAATEAPADLPPTPGDTLPAEAPDAFADAAPSAEAPALAAGVPADQPLAVASAEPAAPDAKAVEVIAGEPPVIPPTRPGAVADVSPDRDAAWANAMAEPPGKAPRLRPQDLVPPEVAATAPTTAGGIPLQPAATEDLLAALAPGAEPLPGASGPALEGALAFATTVQPEAPVVAPGGVSLAGLRPTPRPENLALAEEAQPEEAQPEELAAWDGPSPGPRPEGLAPEAEPSPEVDDAVAQALEAPEVPAETPEAAPAQPDVQSALAAIVANSPDPLAGATRQAVPQARTPAARPANFGRVVATQLDRIARANAPRQAPAIAPPAAQAPAASGNLAANEQAESAPEVASSAAAAPSGPTAASVAQAATFQDAIALREINLIGVYGQPNARHALVRMGNGRYLRVSVGDSLDGGQVTAIGDNALNYVKRGRTYGLVIPGG